MADVNLVMQLVVIPLIGVGIVVGLWYRHSQRKKQAQKAGGAGDPKWSNSA